jgi:hypothetical protein
VHADDSVHVHADDSVHVHGSGGHVHQH